MNQQEFSEVRQARLEVREELLNLKGQAYAGDKDVFDNFKRNAERLGVSKYIIWAVYCQKHLDAIFNAISKDSNNPVDQSEGMLGRIDDAINYLDLLAAMIIEDDKKSCVEVNPTEFYKSVLPRG